MQCTMYGCMCECRLRVHLRRFHAVFFNAPETTEIYTYGHTLSLHDALPILPASRVLLLQSPSTGRAHVLRRQGRGPRARLREAARQGARTFGAGQGRSEEHTSELQSLMRL